MRNIINENRQRQRILNTECIAMKMTTYKGVENDGSGGEKSIINGMCIETDNIIRLESIPRDNIVHTYILLFEH